MKSIIFASLSLFSSFAFSSDNLICKFEKRGQGNYVEPAYNINLKKDFSAATQTTFDVYGELEGTHTLRDNHSVVGEYKMDPSIGDRCKVRLEESAKERRQTTECIINNKDHKNNITSRFLNETIILLESGHLFYNASIPGQRRTSLSADCKDADSVSAPVPSTIVMDMDVYTFFPNYSDYGCSLNGNTDTTYKRNDITVPLSFAGPNSVQFSTDEFSSANCSIRDPKFPKVVTLDFGATSGFSLTPDKFSQIQSVNVSFIADRVGNKVVITSRCSWNFKCGQSGVEVRTGVQK